MAPREAPIVSARACVENTSSWCVNNSACARVFQEEEEKEKEKKEAQILDVPDICKGTNQSPHSKRTPTQKRVHIHAHTTNERAHPHCWGISSSHQ